jgi:alanine dehydrogenase
MPLSIMDGTYITNVRTGAVAGLAAKYLARKDSGKVAVLGSRELARYSLIAVKEVVPSIKHVRVYSPTRKNRELFAEEMKGMMNADIIPIESVDQAVEDADIIITATAAEEPILFDRHVRKDGLFVDCIGAPSEVDPRVLSKAKVVAECEECKTYGRLSKAIEKGFMKESDLYAWLADFISGRKTGRISEKDIILFDSIGFAVEDSIPAWVAYSNAKKMGLGTEIDMYQGLKVWT